MNDRTELHYKLEDILGSKNVYFQPPEDVKLKYPCIIYGKTNKKINRANNVLYNSTQGYSITVIDKDPDSTIADDILASFMMCDYDRHYASDNMHHDALTLYY